MSILWILCRKVPNTIHRSQFHRLPPPLRVTAFHPIILLLKARLLVAMKRPLHYLVPTSGTQAHILPAVRSLAPSLIFISTLKCSVLSPVDGDNLDILQDSLHPSRWLILHLITLKVLYYLPMGDRGVSRAACHLLATHLSIIHLALDPIQRDQKSRRTALKFSVSQKSTKIVI